MVRRNIVLSSELDRELNATAKLLGRKRSAIVAKALSFYLDYVDLGLAKERALRYESGDDAGLTADELRAELGL
jgi:predicted DNA-binding protein